MKLLVYKYDNLELEVLLKPGKLYTVGRKESCDIVLDKIPGISREHFEIDEDGSAWRVNVLSEVMLIEFEGEERKDLQLKGHGSFTLLPYRFEFLDEESHKHTHKNSSKNQNESVVNDVNQNFSDIKIVTAEDMEPQSKEPEKFDGNEEKTAIHSFNGLPYIKIIGQNGKKSEFFRLEGNLWIVGGHESASVYIREPSAAQNHFEISKTDKGYFVVDSGTPQGTDLNGQKLTKGKPSRLFSGDILTVGDTSVQFELRDKAFKRKVSNIPLNMYNNPLVFFDQDVAMVSLADEELSNGSAEELKYDPLADKSSQKTKMIRFALVGIVTLAACAYYLLPAEEDNKKVTIGADPFSQLPPTEQKIVIQTYKLAKQLYLAGNFELASVQLEKLHEKIPSYKDSQEMEEYCINSRELKSQQALIERQKREQEELAARVSSFIAQCNQQFATSDDIEGARACLAPASDLDPNNPSISQLITDVTARSEEQKIRQKMLAEQEDKVRRGRELYQKAKALHGNERLLEAIEAYENHIHSGLPDPKNLVKISKRSLAAIEKKVRSEKMQLFGDAQNKYGGTNLKDAIKMARKAQQVDPYDPNISTFIFKVEQELKSKMKSLYMDSVIEERFGNLDACKQKWEQIVKTDIEDGEYFKKAKRKLNRYGFKH